MTDIIKRGRKSKNTIIEPIDSTTTTHVPKKRGRKPKGGKIVQHNIELDNIIDPSPNIILHLKCSLKDIESINSLNPIQTHDTDLRLNKKTDLKFHEMNALCNHEELPEYSTQDPRKNLHDKVKELEKLLHFNNINNHKSACFWCTYNFDNPPIYIPKFQIKDTYHVYGCFCSPECATAFLTEEDIDTSSKFERYQLLNYLYAKIYNYNRNIKPAPNPHYTLTKFCGNLTIQEYRELLQNDNLLLIVDKPLTRIMPELHEDNDDFLLNNKSIPSNTTLKLKRNKINTNTSKSDILSENFGFA